MLLRVVDSLWMDHIDFLEQLRSEIGLQAIGNHDPVVAYKKESFEAFDKVVNQIRQETAKFLINYKINIEIKQSKPQPQQNMITNTDKSITSASSDKLTGRNEPCPCGSGKKYKNCCGNK